MDFWGKISQNKKLEKMQAIANYPFKQLQDFKSKERSTTGKSTY